MRHVTILRSSPVLWYARTEPTWSYGVGIAAKSAHAAIVKTAPAAPVNAAVAGRERTRRGHDALARLSRSQAPAVTSAAVATGTPTSETGQYGRIGLERAASSIGTAPARPMTAPIAPGRPGPQRGEVPEAAPGSKRKPTARRARPPQRHEGPAAAAAPPSAVMIARTVTSGCP